VCWFYLFRLYHLEFNKAKRVESLLLTTNIGNDNVPNSKIFPERGLVWPTEDIYHKTL
jgi:hypothetical protein